MVRHYPIRGVNFGLILLVIGLVWFAKDIGWLPYVPLAPTILILVAIWWLFGRGNGM